jgi:hypothetical protein
MVVGYFVDFFKGGGFMEDILSCMLSLTYAVGTSLLSGFVGSSLDSQAFYL